MSDVFVPIAFFFSVAWVIKVLSDNKTKRMIIERAGLSENIKFLYHEPQKHVGPSLKWGLVLVAIGLALIIFKIFFYYESEEVAFGLMFLAAGLGLLFYYFIARTAKPENNSLPLPKEEVKEEKPE